MGDESAKNSKLAGFSELGRRCGESHHQAVLTDHEVELIRTLRLEHKIPLGVLAEKFEVTKGYISLICTFQRRVTPAVEWRRAVVDDSSAHADNPSPGDAARDTDGE